MDENSIRKIQPHNKEAEQSVIGAMLMDRDVISDVADLLTREDFYNAQYGILYEAMVELYNEGKPVDMVTLRDYLKKKDVPEEISDPVFIGEIIATVPTSANAKQYAQIVQDKSILRRLIKLCEKRIVFLQVRVLTKFLKKQSKIYSSLFKAETVLQILRQSETL